MTPRPERFAWPQLMRLGLQRLGLTPDVFWNLTTAALYEHAIKRDEGFVAHKGPLVVRTGQYTGRSPNDKYIVREPGSEKDVWWESARSFSPDSLSLRSGCRSAAALASASIFAGSPSEMV